MTIPLRGSLVDWVTPLDEVLHSVLDESIFAANLTEALLGTAPQVYSDPALFFQRTHPSSGLRELLRMALGRLSGATPDESPVIRVDTNLGGGKTHNLIALGHACRGGLAAAEVETYLGPNGSRWLTAIGHTRIGTFVGSDPGVSSEEGTMWGLLAQDIAGPAGYALVRADDVARSAPGVVVLKRLLADEPTLIIIDEIAHYLEKASAIEVGDSTLANQVLTFLMSLCEAAAQCRRAVIVITTTQESQVFHDRTEQVVNVLSQTLEITGRQAHLIQPAAETDIPGVLTRRLFAKVDRSHVEQIARAYSESLREAETLFGGLPKDLSPELVTQRIRETWPFHPELIGLFDKRLSTNPYFQRTRGALRLLARTVQLLWQKRGSTGGPLCIHPHHLDLADGEIIRPQLTGALHRSSMEQVARADIVSHNTQPSRAQIIDEGSGHTYARNTGTVCFLESLTQTAGSPSQGAILGTTLQPNDDANRMLAAWENLNEEAWYLHREGNGFRFKTEPSLSRLIHDYTELVPNTRAIEAAMVLLETMFAHKAGTGKGGVFRVCRIYRNEKPTDNVKDVNLCIFSWAQFPGHRGLTHTSQPPDTVLDLWGHTDAGGLRQFRNRIVFVAPDATYYEAMIAALKLREALETLSSNPDLVQGLSKEARSTLQMRRQSQQLNARVAVANVMRLVWYPATNSQLRSLSMPVGSTARAERHQLDVIYDELGVAGKWMAPEAADVDPAALRQELGNRLQDGCSVSDIEKFMATNCTSRVLLDLKILSTLLRNGVRNGEWDYQQTDGQWFTQTSEAGHLMQVESSGLVFSVGTAPASRNCDDESEDDKTEDDPFGPPPPPLLFTCKANPDVVVNELMRQAQSAGRTQAAQFSIEWGAEESAALPCLIRTFQIINGFKVQQSLLQHLILTLKVQSQLEGQNSEVMFMGTDVMSQAFSEPMKAMLRQGVNSVFEANIVVKFEKAVPLNSTWSDHVVTAMRGAKVTNCSGTLETIQE